MAEIWGVAIAGVAAAGAGLAGAALSSSAQASAAQTAAGAQEQAAQLQANTSAGIYNAQQVQNQPARVAGGEALQEEAYLLGLNPNLDISGDTAIAQINPNLNSTNGSGLTFTGQGSNGINNELGLGSLATGQGANSAGGYGSVNGIPASGNYLSNWGAAPQLGPGNNGYGGTTQVPQGTSNTQPITSGTATTQSLTPGSYSAFRGGSVNPSTNGMSPITSTQGPTASTNVIANQTSAPTSTGTSINPISGTPNNNTSGYGSLSSVYNPSTFYNDPSYQFEMGQEQLAANKQEAASGGLYSTGALDQALQYAQGLAATDYNNAFNRSQSAQNQQFNYLQALTGGGQVATNNVTSAGSTAASNIGSASTGYGNASAAGTIGAANAYTNGINQGTGFVTNAINGYSNSLNNSGAGSNPYNLGGSTAVAPAGSQLTYDAYGNITGSVPITS